MRLNIPSGPARQDLIELCATYDLPRPENEAAHMLWCIGQSHGIARITDKFKLARRLAEEMANRSPGRT